jgi:hypothetical protein
MTGYMIGMMPCLIHGELFACDPETVITVRIDPQTRRPPDVGEDGQPCEPDPAAEQRTVQVAVCDECIETKINPDRVARDLPPWPLARDMAGRGGHFGWPHD